MSKTITVSDKTYEKIKEQIVTETKKENIEIKSKFSGSKVLYSSERETIKEALIEAVNQDANLQDANLQDADLRYVDLKYTNLKGANLQGANLQCANLQCANLRDANLQGANLQDVDLRDADLQGADFYHAKFYGKGGNTKIKKNQVDDFLKALGIIVE